MGLPGKSLTMTKRESDPTDVEGQDNCMLWEKVSIEKIHQTVLFGRNYFF